MQTLTVLTPGMKAHKRSPPDPNFLLHSPSLTVQLQLGFLTQAVGLRRLLRIMSYYRFLRWCETQQWSPSTICSKSITTTAMLCATCWFWLRTFLIYCEPLVGGESYTWLQLVLCTLWNIIFVAFHTNLIGGHFNAVRTFHHIWLRYYWPNMYKYIDGMCRSCPGCILANRTKMELAESVYNFPIEVPFLMIHCDIYVAGKFAGFEGCTVFLIACCGMCSFACMEPVVHANAESFASALS